MNKVQRGSIFTNKAAAQRVDASGIPCPEVQHYGGKLLKTGTVGHIVTARREKKVMCQMRDLEQRNLRQKYGNQKVNVQQRYKNLDQIVPRLTDWVQ
eukprot:g25495.t1